MKLPRVVAVAQRVLYSAFNRFLHGRYHIGRERLRRKLDEQLLRISALGVRRFVGRGVKNRGGRPVVHAVDGFCQCRVVKTAIGRG